MLFVVAMALVAAVAVAAFLWQRASTALVLRSGAVLRAANDARRDAWEAESAVRLYALAADSAAVAPARRGLAELREHLRELRRLTAGDTAQQARIDSLDAATDAWLEGFISPILRTGTITRDVGVAGTRLFEPVSAGFNAVIESATARREERIAAQRVVQRLGLAAVLVALLSAAVAFTWLARELSAAAVAAERHRAEAEAQAALLQEQAGQLQEQAATLEEQAAELEHQLEEREGTMRLLEETGAFLDSAVASAPVGIAFYDRELRFQRINDALARINGAPAAAHLGRTIEEMIPALAPTIRPILERVLASGATEADVVIEGETPALPGARRRWLVTYYPIASADRPPIGVGCMVLDVTERAALEDQLRQAAKMEAVGRLAGGIAHDFNNILTIIQSYAEVLAADLAPGAQGREEIEAIRGAADRATTLARKLLTFSRRDVVIPRDLDVNATIAGMETILRRLLRQGVELRLDLADEPLFVRMDGGQLEQVLMNLAINGVDAMPAGGVLHIVTARSETLPQPDGELARPAVLIRVLDEGTGMPPEVRERLFEPFFTTKPRGQGTGLGLATSYAIIRDAKGHIRVESVPGDGSRFEVCLPLVQPAEGEPATRPSPMRGLPAAGSGETVLLAEDEPAIRRALSRVLQANGYRVLEAGDGEEALRVAGAEAGQIHVLLTDVMMPGMGGKELVRRLRADRPGTRVILMSGYTDDAELRAELGDARHVFLQKPFAARQVVTAVRELLDHP